MPTPTPAVRAALLGILALTVATAAAAWLHVDRLREQASLSAQHALDERAEFVAAALRPLAANRGRLSGAFEAYAQIDGPAEISLVDASGALVSTSDADLARGVPWGSVIEHDPVLGRLTVPRGADLLLVSARRVSGSPYSVVASRLGSSVRLPAGTTWGVLSTAAALWGFVVGVMIVLAWYAGPQTAERLRRLGERIAQGDANPDLLVRHAEQGLGSLASAFLPLGRRLVGLGASVQGAREHVAALYQVNPHYVLLCTLDGRIVEANPAFYAITGLPAEAVRGGRIEALAESFPVEPLLEMADRSLREGSAIGGIEYALVDRDDQGRPVEVALRAFRQGETDLVLIQATDVAVRRTLERRVAAFSDTLDLMVDRRVEQLAAGQQSLRRLLDTAGIVVASFDSGGGTRRWSGAAQALSGRPPAGVPHFASASASLGLSDDDRAAFARWFWSLDDAPFAGLHTPPAGDGAPVRARWMVWHKVEADHAGRADHRTVIGVEVPAAPTGIPTAMPTGMPTAVAAEAYPPQSEPAPFGGFADDPHAGDGMARQATDPGLAFDLDDEPLASFGAADRPVASLDPLPADAFAPFDPEPGHDALGHDALGADLPGLDALGAPAPFDASTLATTLDGSGTEAPPDDGADAR